MTTVSEFRAALSKHSASDIIDRFNIEAKPQHVTSENIEFIRSTVSASFQVQPQNVLILITGSASIGFSLIRERLRDRSLIPRYQMFSTASDIDVAVVSDQIFELILRELSGYSHQQSYFSWRAERLGDYLICGWLRPDHFPKGVRLRHCDQWSDTFYRLSRDVQFRRRRVNGGLFYLLFHLKQYLSRAVNECIREEGEL